MQPQNDQPKPDWFESSRLIPAVVLIGIGALFFLNNMHIFPAHEVLKYWPGILVAVGVMLLVDSKEQSAKTVGGIFAGVGALLLARNVWFIDVGWNQLW